MMSLALKAQGLPPAEKLILIGIANHADAFGGNSYPAMATLAGYAGVSVRQARRYVRSLADKQIITVEENAGGRAGLRADQRPNRYAIDDRTLVTGRDDQRPDTQRANDRTPSAQRPDIAMSAEPSLTVQEPKDPPISSSGDDGVFDSIFDAFWKQYPRKTGKPAAKKALKPVANQPEAIVTGLAKWVEFWNADRTEQRFIPHPATWLNQRRWEDDPPPIAAVAFDPMALALLMAPWFTRRYDSLTAESLVPTIRTLQKWEFGPGEIAVRMAAMSRHNLAGLSDPQLVTRLSGFARFSGDPKAFGDEGVNYVTAMERAYQNQRWSNQ